MEAFTITMDIKFSDYLVVTDRYAVCNYFSNENGQIVGHTCSEILKGYLFDVDQAS
jgi:hypothetical protein